MKNSEYLLLLIEHGQLEISDTAVPARPDGCATVAAEAETERAFSEEIDYAAEFKHAAQCMTAYYRRNRAIRDPHTSEVIGYEMVQTGQVPILKS